MLIKHFFILLAFIKVYKLTASTIFINSSVLYIIESTDFKFFECKISYAKEIVFNSFSGMLHFSNTLAENSVPVVRQPVKVNLSFGCEIIVSITFLGSLFHSCFFIFLCFDSESSALSYTLESKLF